MEIPAGQGRVAAICPLCERATGLDLVATTQLFPSHSRAAPAAIMDGATVVPMRVALETRKCQFCRQTSSRAYGYRRTGVTFEEQPSESWMVWPRVSGRSLPETVPEVVRSLHLEASQCSSVGALRGAAAMLRACVEEVCSEQQSTGRDLYHRIESLASAGLSQDIIEDLHEARLLGNWTLHDAVEFSADEVEDVAHLIADALYVIYVQPAERQAMKEARRVRRDARGTSSA